MKRLVTLIYCIACGVLAGSWDAAWPGPFVAYSLGAAAKLASADGKAAGLKTLAGMTRILGMVHDPAGDVVLVGRVVEGHAGATLDDLVIALRARLVHDEWPTVSLDPTAESAATGLHAVTWRGGIAASRFGADFLRADIFLKQLSLQATSKARLPTFRALLEDGIKVDLRRQGVEVGGVDWRAMQDLASRLKPLLDSAVSSEVAYQVRFWFSPQQPRFVARAGVFAIDALQLGVEVELLSSGARPDADQRGASAFVDASQAFASSLTQTIADLMTANASVNRLKILYDLVAVAEGLRYLENVPDLSYFMRHHAVKRVETPTSHRMTELLGLVHRSDNVRQVLVISGGVRFAAEIEWLNAGDVTPLREIVLTTRPRPDALTWVLPLDGWHMPNSHDLQRATLAAGVRAPGNNASPPGFSLSTQSIVLQVPAHALRGPVLRDVLRATPVPPLDPKAPRMTFLDRLGGVSINVEVNEHSFRHDMSDALSAMRTRILNTRPRNGALAWPAVPTTPAPR